VEINFEVQTGESLSISLLDVNGRTVRILRDKHFYNTGSHIVHFNSEKLNPGSYFLKLTGKYNNSTLKFIKQ